MIVITGATGNVGQTLAAAGEQVTAVSRGAWEPPDGVRHRRADLAEAETLRPILDGADALFLVVPSQDLKSHDILDVAKTAGVQRVVLMSSQGARTRPLSRYHAYLQTFEEAVRESGLEW